ncbi:MAG: hypothetical protein R3E08_11830 [Thiotrichaceae bacterium]
MKRRYAIQLQVILTVDRFDRLVIKPLPYPRSRQQFSIWKSYPLSDGFREPKPGHKLHLHQSIPTLSKHTFLVKPLLKHYLNAILIGNSQNPSGKNYLPQRNLICLFVEVIHRYLLLIFILFYSWFSTAFAAINCAVQTDIPQSQCKVLIELYISTNGASWTDSPSNNWNVTIPHVVGRRDV